jgi:hypothetical protein
MIIHTTININDAIMTRLDNAVLSTGKTRSDLIVDVMKKVLGEYRGLLTYRGRVRYQEKGPGDSWKRMHITLLARDYEFFLDSRKLFKRSVSFLIAYAIIKYLDEVCNNPDNQDNYQFIHYAIVPKIVDTAICWKIYWGFPIKKHKILQ